MLEKQNWFDLWMLLCTSRSQSSMLQPPLRTCGYSPLFYIGLTIKVEHQRIVAYPLKCEVSDSWLVSFRGEGECVALMLFLDSLLSIMVYRGLSFQATTGFVQASRLVNQRISIPQSRSTNDASINGTYVPDWRASKWLKLLRALTIRWPRYWVSEEASFVTGQMPSV